MKNLLVFSIFGVVVANLLAFAAGTRSGLTGMVVVDFLCIVTAIVVLIGWFIRRSIDPAKRAGGRALKRADDAAVEVAARSISAARKVNKGVKSFSARVSDRAEKLNR